jgi:uridine kinase
VKATVIGVAGGTASGKTTICGKVAERLGAALLTHDRYYRDVSDPGTHNYDHPDALDTASMVEALDALRRGEAATVPVYDFPRHTRVGFEAFTAGELVIVEGILVLASPAVRARLDLAVWVEAADDVRLCRRILRDLEGRGRSVESVIAQYLGTVRPMHRAFVAPSRRHAQLELDGEGDLEVAVGRLVRAIGQLKRRAPAAASFP